MQQIAVFGVTGRMGQSLVRALRGSPRLRLCAAVASVGSARLGQDAAAEGEPTGESGKALEQAFPRFADDLSWWVEAAKAQRQHKPPPY